MLINIRYEYLAFLSAIQKNWKNKTTNLVGTVLQIIREFEFIEGIKKSKLVF